jgi:hypothetical protein
MHDSGAARREIANAYLDLTHCDTFLAARWIASRSLSTGAARAKKLWSICGCEYHPLILWARMELTNAILAGEHGRVGLEKRQIGKL